MAEQPVKQIAFACGLLCKNMVDRTDTKTDTNTLIFFSVNAFLFPKEKGIGIAAILSSQVLAQLSTIRNAGGLICRVRDESGSCPAAMAAIPNHLYFSLLI